MPPTRCERATLGGAVPASDVSIDCACPGSCAATAGESPEGKACGLETAARELRRGMLQDASTEMEVEFSVEAADALRDIVTDTIDARPLSSTHSALCEFSNRIRALRKDTP